MLSIMTVKAISLQSGSSGNCIYVEAGGVRLLFDAGITGVQTKERLAAAGRDVRDVDAVIISHDHADHCSHAGVLQRKFGLPVYMTPATYAAAAARCPLGKMKDVRHFRSCDKLRFGDVVVHAVPTPHDGADGSVFVIEAGGKRLGVMTDLGHVFKDLIGLVSSLDAVFLESNYDPDMLSHGPYPVYLKQRIKGPRGHISNIEAAEVLSRAGAGSRLQWACLAHLSEQNNHPEVALRTHREVVADTLTLYVADRYKASDVFTVV
ncbi:MAG TPA: MBL fold metallo-hydrolase [Nitrospirota bacterium]|nr:MBL fold metallo-hydrolase [Nitrospirota bacterium]